MERLLILGAGQYGLVAKEVAEAMECFSSIDFLDDHSEIAIGKLNDIENIEYDAAFVAIGNPAMRVQYLDRIGKAATLIQPKACVSLSAKIGESCVVEAGAVICSDAKIGKGTIIMANAVVGHNATIGECCQLKYNCTVPESCVVPDKTKVDCNGVFRDNTYFKGKNQKFIESKTKKKGVETRFF